MGHHVHRADPEHGAIHVVAEEHMVHIMVFLLAVEEDFFFPGFFQILARRNKKTGGAAGRVADDVIGFRVHQLHHHADDMARGTELTVEAGLADFAEQIFVGVAAHVHRLGFVHQAVNLVQRIHHLGKQQRCGQLENGVIHILGIGAVLSPWRFLIKGNTHSCTTEYIFPAGKS